MNTMAVASSSSAPEPEPEPEREQESQHEPSSHEPQPSSLPIKKPPPIPWSHIETVNLIECYQEKWYSLKRGQLKSSQWEEVSVSVAARCGYDEPSKTATQCRHKIEKLRKRYRTERQRPSPSVWPFFRLMDFMEHGPFPISARPIALIEHRHSDTSGEEDGDNDDDETNKSRSINHILRRPVSKTSASADKSSFHRQWNGNSGGVPGVSRFLRNPMYRKRRKSFEFDDEEEEEEEEEGGGGELLSELASVVRAFGEGFVRVENMKMEMMRETERYRMQMEAKRTELILDSQRRIVDAIAKALGSQKKSKKAQEL